MNLPPFCPSRERFEHALESTCRVLTGEPGSLARFSTDHKDGVSTYFPLSLPDEGLEDHGSSENDLAYRQISAIRGTSDAIAVKIRYHDADLHQSMAPSGPLSRSIYDEFENLRIEALASKAMSGVAANLAAFFDHRCRHSPNFITLIMIRWRPTMLSTPKKNICSYTAVRH